MGDGTGGTGLERATKDADQAHLETLLQLQAMQQAGNGQPGNGADIAPNPANMTGGSGIPAPPVPVLPQGQGAQGPQVGPVDLGRTAGTSGVNRPARPEPAPIGGNVDEFHDPVKQTENPSGGAKVLPAAPLDPLHQYAGMMGLGGANVGPMGMERQDINGIKRAAEEKKLANAHGMQADLAINDASKKPLQEQADYTKAANTQGAQRMNEAYAQEGSFLDRAAAANDEYNKIKTDIDPQHYWHSMETPNKIITGISLLLGGAGAGFSGGPNHAMDMVKRNIEADTKAQVENIQNKMTQKHNVGEAFKGLSGIAHRRFKSAGEQMAFLNNAKAQETSATLKAIAARYGDPKIKAEAEQKAAEITSWGVGEVNKAHTENNKATLQGTEASRNLAEAARSKFLIGHDSMRLAMDQQKLAAEQGSQTVMDPDTGKPMLNAQGQPIIHEKAYDINQKLGGLASTDENLKHAQGQLNGIGWGNSTANAAYNAAVAGALSSLPADERAAIAGAIPGPNDIGSPAQAIQAVRSMINVRKSRLRQEIGGTPGAATLGGTQHTGN